MAGMETVIVEAFPFISIGVLLVGIVTLVIAVLALRSMRRSMKLAEKRTMDNLRDEQVRLAFLREEHQRLVEELKQERQERPEEVLQGAEHSEQERSAELEREHGLLEEPQREQEQRLETQRQAEEREQESMGDSVDDLVNGYIEGVAKKPEEKVTFSIELSKREHAKLLWLAKNFNTQKTPLAERLLNAAMDEAIERYARWASPDDPAKFLEELPAYIEGVERDDPKPFVR